MEEIIYDYLIVGAGLAGSVFAYCANKAGKRCLVIDKRNHIGGNLYQEKIEGITVHKYGAHIFRTNNKSTWEFVNKFVHFNNFINSPVANYHGKLYNLPFNMNTFNQLWGVNQPWEAKRKILLDSIKNDNPKNLEEHCLNTVGQDIYYTLIKEYTEKQWGKPCTELPKETMRRIPLRFTYDNNYYNAKYQGIPIEGYNLFIEKLLAGSDVVLNTSYEDAKEVYAYKKVVYTGALDELYHYRYGALQWRSLRFENAVYEYDNVQGVAVMNYTDDRPYTRTIEHKHFLFDTTSPKSVITYEYPDTWMRGREPYYPVNNEETETLYARYLSRAEKDGLIVCGRLGAYKYLDMAETIESVLTLAKRCLSG